MCHSLAFKFGQRAPDRFSFRGSTVSTFVGTRTGISIQQQISSFGFFVQFDSSGGQVEIVRCWLLCANVSVFDISLRTCFFYRRG